MPELTNIEISRRGRWTSVPALSVDENSVVVSGKWIKMAAVHDEDWLEREIGDPSVFIEALKSQSASGLKADIFTFAQKIPKVEPAYSYPMVLDSIAVVNLSSFDQWWNGLPQESRKNVRRSQKRGVVVEVKPFDDDLVRGIVDVNNDSPVRQGRRYTHYGKSFEEVKRDHAAFVDRSEFICAYLGGKIIGFLKLVYLGNIASILQLTPKASHSDQRPANALLAKAMELCAYRGIRQVIYGRFNYGNKGNTSVREFKVRNGFREVLVPRYYVPLTTWGAFCVRTRLYRGWIDIAPRSVIALALRLRAGLYHRYQN